jgi:hypothetical protein
MGSAYFQLWGTQQDPFIGPIGAITNQPEPAILAQDGAATNLTFGITGVPFSLQWYFNGTNVLPDATNATLAQTFTFADQGSYQCVASSPYGSATSSVAVVTINRAPVAADINAGAQQGVATTIPLSAWQASKWSDPDGDAVSLAGAVAASTNGSPVSTDGTNIAYLPLLAGGDMIGYTISDSRGGQAEGRILMSVIASNVPVPVMTGILPQSNGAVVSFAGIPWQGYDLQRAPTPLGTWQSFTNAVASPGGVTSVLDESPFPGSGFYRAGTTNP